MRRKLAAGNWKMNGTGADLSELRTLAEAWPAAKCEILLCPPATLVDRMARHAQGSSVLVGGQDCHPAARGAHTGDISAAMLAEAGASHVIVGHSERRADHGESDALVRAKAEAALAAGLVAIICVGETLDERKAGRALEIVGGQLRGSLPEGAKADRLVIAYEPVWAIGTGEVPTMDEIAEIHRAIRSDLHDILGTGADQVRILYGGSVKPSNAAEIFAVDDVDGALVGGASLKAADFGGIIAALSASHG